MFLSLTTSLLCFLLIGADRLYSITRPIQYRTRITKTGLKMRVAAVWIISLLVSPLGTLALLELLPSSLSILLLVIACGAVTIILNMCLYPIAYIMARKSCRQIAKFVSGTVPNNSALQNIQPQVEKLKQLRLMRMFCIIFSVYIFAFVLFVPYGMIGFFSTLDGVASFPPLLPVITMCLFKLSSILNPIIIIIMKKELRPSSCFNTQS